MTAVSGGSRDTDNIRAPTSSTLSAGVFTLSGDWSPYGRDVSGAMENRSAVFANQPQAVEVYRDGAWWPGSLLGWRHDDRGGCQVRVRLAADEAEDATWTALDYLRLPEVALAAPAVRHLSVVDAPAESAGDSPLTATIAALRAVPSAVARNAGHPVGPSELTATMNLVAVRDRDEETPSVAPAAEVPARRSGGRRRAPEVAGAGGPASTVPSSPGRHRAPAPAADVDAEGRHRASDTGVWPAVRVQDAPEPSQPAAPSLLGHPGEDLLTRPMRLDDISGRVPRPRRPALEGRLAGR